MVGVGVTVEVGVRVDYHVPGMDTMYQVWGYATSMETMPQAWRLCCIHVAMLHAWETIMQPLDTILQS